MVDQELSVTPLKTVNLTESTESTQHYQDSSKRPVFSVLSAICGDEACSYRKQNRSGNKIVLGCYAMLGCSGQHSSPQ